MLPGVWRVRTRVCVCVCVSICYQNSFTQQLLRRRLLLLTQQPPSSFYHLLPLTLKYTEELPDELLTVSADIFTVFSNDRLEHKKKTLPAETTSTTDVPRDFGAVSLIC